jgi:hypothetical protein
MVQIIDENRRPSKWSLLGQGIAEGSKNFVQDFGDLILKNKENQKKEKLLHEENESIKKNYGINLSGIRDPKQRQNLVELALTDKNKALKFANEIKNNEKIIEDLEKKRNLEPGSLSAYKNDPKMAEQISRPKKEEKPAKLALTEKPVPKEISQKINKILKENPTASADELRSIMDLEEIPPVYSNSYTENRRRAEESLGKSSESKQNALRLETLPMRQKIAEKAQIARESIENKNSLLGLIDKGNINDPAWTIFSELLPFNLGKRLLSNDTVEYKGGLVDNYKDLRSIFSGATRVSEIDILSDKIADLYLTDEQKKAILKSRINAAKVDIIKAEAAAELENKPNIGTLQFNEELEKIARPKIDALFNQIIDENKAIIQNAENRKKISLNTNDPEDKKIAQDILKEAGGDRNKARQLAKKKGYVF